MSYPVRANRPVEVYAGDAAVFGGEIIITEGGLPLDVSSWTGWAATWRPSVDSARYVQLSVDTTNAAQGRLVVSADAADTRRMQDLLLGRDTGVWDLTSTKDSKPRTWVYGETIHREEVTR